MIHATSTFRQRVLAIVRRIPPGRVATYGDIAASAGSPRAARAVGTAMRECRDRRVPCHRVIGAAGALGGYGGNLHIKRELLRAEGLDVGVSRVRRFADVRWVPRTAVRSILRAGAEQRLSGLTSATRPRQRPPRRTSARGRGGP